MVIFLYTKTVGEVVLLYAVDHLWVGLKEATQWMESEKSVMDESVIRWHDPGFGRSGPWCCAAQWK